VLRQRVRHSLRRSAWTREYCQVIPRAQGRREHWRLYQVSSGAFDMSESESADALDLDLSRVRSRTPLHKAVGQRRADMVRFLLNAKADINAKEVRRR